MATLGATRAEFGADYGARTGWVTELVEQDLGHIDIPFQLYFYEDSTNDVTADGVVIKAYVLPIPDYVGQSEGFLNLTLEFKTSNVAHTAYWRLVNDTDSINGTWQETNVASYDYTREDSTGKVQLGTPADTDRLTTINVMAKIENAASTCTIRSTLGLTAWFSET